ncbi:MAG: hypothetical protein GWO86_00175, partial [Planctomycetes bacterium]|nr:hypothetical protein [Planctomycetota bacterium]
EVRSSSLAVAASGGSLFERICRLVGKDSMEKEKSGWVPSVFAIILLIALLVPAGFALSSKTSENRNLPRMQSERLTDIQKSVEDFFKHNYRDITARKTLEWGEPAQDANGNTSIRYKYEATIWGKDKIITDQLFVFDKSGKLLSFDKIRDDIKLGDVSQLKPRRQNEPDVGDVEPGTDVAVEDFRIQPYVAGGLYTVTVKIRNSGTETVPAFRLNFYRGDPAEDLNLHDKRQSGSHGAGPIEAEEVWNERSSPFALEQGWNEITVVLDIDNKIAEANENNNFAKMKILFEDGKIIKKSVDLSNKPNVPTKAGYDNITDKIIVPGKRVGEYTFGMSKDDVLEILGKPRTIFYGKERYTLDDLPGTYYMVFDDISFRILDDSVKEITAISPYYRFANGLGVGDSEQKIKQAFGDDFYFKETKWKDFLTYKDKGLGFEINKDDRTVMEINVLKIDDSLTPRTLTQGFGKRAYIPPTSTINEKGYIVDKVDYPFINDREVLGVWKSVDFVNEIKDFKVGEKQWKGRGGKLFLREMVFKKNGKLISKNNKVPKGYLGTWTKGLVIYDNNTKTASKYTIKTIDGSAYMFYEWKSGDYTFRHQKPSYYVLKNVSLRPNFKPSVRVGGFKRKLKKSVTVDVSKSPGSDRLTVQYAVIEVCKAAGVPYQWKKSAKLADTQRREYIKPISVKKITAEKVLTDILRPVGLDYGLDAKGLYLYRNGKINRDSLLNETQKLYAAWTDKKFADYLDCSEFSDLSEQTRKELETKWISILSNSRDRQWKQYNAINCLATIKSKKAIRPLLRIATGRGEKNNRDRWMATRALGLIGEERIAPRLIPLLYHYNQNTRLWAQISLVRLTGQNFGSDWNNWGKWWNDSGKRPKFTPRKIRWTTNSDWADADKQQQADNKFIEKLKTDIQQKNTKGEK